MNIYIEIFGYIGTVLVIVSMMMTSVLKLRVINICGGFISMVYSIIGGAWPVVVMNFCLIVINIFQIIKQFRQKQTFGHITVDENDASLKYFLSYYKNDIEKYFPEYTLKTQENTEIHITYIEGEPAGVLVGTRENNILNIEMDYAAPKYRDFKVAKFLFSQLSEEGITTLTANAEKGQDERYLKRLGFSNDGGIMKKQLEGEKQ